MNIKKFSLILFICVFIGLAVSGCKSDVSREKQEALQDNLEDAQYEIEETKGEMIIRLNEISSSIYYIIDESEEIALKLAFANSMLNFSVDNTGEYYKDEYSHYCDIEDKTEYDDGYSKAHLLDVISDLQTNYNDLLWAYKDLKDSYTYAIDRSGQAQADIQSCIDEELEKLNEYIYDSLYLTDPW